jgi:hypothetical protein
METAGTIGTWAFAITGARQTKVPVTALKKGIAKVRFLITEPVAFDKWLTETDPM